MDDPFKHVYDKYPLLPALSFPFSPLQDLLWPQNFDFFFYSNRRKKLKSPLKFIIPVGFYRDLLSNGDYDLGLFFGTIELTGIPFTIVVGII